LVEQEFDGPVRVSGSAGTGKTVVALHRAARMADRSPTARVLLTTFSDPLAVALERRLKILLRDTAAGIPRIRVPSFLGVAKELLGTYARPPPPQRRSNFGDLLADEGGRIAWRPADLASAPVVRVGQCCRFVAGYVGRNLWERS